MDRDYAGLMDDIMYFENTLLPICLDCSSEDTASVQVGIIQRSINIAAATTKFKLIANGPKLGEYYCNSCRKFFSIPENQQWSMRHAPTKKLFNK